MKIKLSCGEVEIRPLPVYADKAVELLSTLQGLGSKDDPFKLRRDFILEVLCYAEPKQTSEALCMGDILVMSERLSEIVAAALPMPQVPLLEKIVQPGDEVLNGEDAFKALKAAGMVSDGTGKAAG